MLSVSGITGLGFPGNSPQTTASLPFRNVSSWPCSLAVHARESQDNVVYCFNICLTQSKPSSGDSLSVICVSVKEISRQIRCLGAHRGTAGFATGVFCRRETPVWKGRKPPFCMEINSQSAGEPRAAAWNVASLQIHPFKQLRVEGVLLVIFFLFSWNSFFF